MKGTSQPSTSYQQFHTCHTHTSYLANPQNTNSTAQLANYQEISMHSNGESLNRRRSLHERWKGELIMKERSTIDRTATPGKEGWHKLGQQPGLESSGRPTIGRNSPNLGHRAQKTDLQRWHRKWSVQLVRSSPKETHSPMLVHKIRPSQESGVLSCWHHEWTVHECLSTRLLRR